MSELAYREPSPVPAPVAEASGPVQIGALIQHALSSGASVESLERLTTWAKEMQAIDAKAAFERAFSQFQAECPVIPHDQSVNYVTKSGFKVNYRWASLAQIRRVAGPCLYKYGFTYRWNQEVIDGSISITCYLTHTSGHCVTASFKCNIEQNDKFSSGQNTSAAETYARRKSLTSVLGVSTDDNDPDGNGPHGQQAPPVERGPTITEDQAANLGALLDEVKVPHATFCKAFRIERIGDLPASEYKAAITRAEAKRGGK